MEDNDAMGGEGGRLRPDLGRITSSSTTTSSWSSASQLARGLGVVGREAEASSGAATSSDMRISSDHRSSSADERFSASSLDLEEAEGFDGLSPLAMVPGWGGCSPVRSSDRNAVSNTSRTTTGSGLPLNHRQLLPHSLQPAPQVHVGVPQAGQVQMYGAHVLAFPDEGLHPYSTTIAHVASIERDPPQPSASEALDRWAAVGVLRPEASSNDKPTPMGEGLGNVRHQAAQPQEGMGFHSNASDEHHAMAHTTSRGRLQYGSTGYGARVGSSSHAGHQAPVTDWHSGPRT